jgi:hypothetical protein
MSRQFFDRVHIQSPLCSILCSEIHDPSNNLLSGELLRQEAPAPQTQTQTQIRCLQGSTSRRLRTSKASFPKTSAFAVRKCRRHKIIALEWQISSTNGHNTNTTACTASESTKRNEGKAQARSQNIETPRKNCFAMDGRTVRRGGWRYTLRALSLAFSPLQ